MLSYVIIFMVEKMNYIKINLKLNNPLASGQTFQKVSVSFGLTLKKKLLLLAVSV